MFKKNYQLSTEIHNNSQLFFIYILFHFNFKHDIDYIMLFVFIMIFIDFSIIS
jgi:hypothetical protein